MLSSLQGVQVTFRLLQHLHCGQLKYIIDELEHFAIIQAIVSIKHAGPLPADY